MDNFVERRKEGASVEAIIKATVDSIRQECTFLSIDEHAFLKALIQREKIKADRWESIKTQILGWGALALIGWLGTILLAWIRELK